MRKIHRPPPGEVGIKPESEKYITLNDPPRHARHRPTSQLGNWGPILDADGERGAQLSARQLKSRELIFHRVANCNAPRRVGGVRCDGSVSKTLILVSTPNGRNASYRILRYKYYAHRRQSIAGGRRFCRR